VARAALVNFSFPKAPHSRVVVVSASYDSSPNKTIEVILKALEGLEALALDPPPSVRLIAHSESALTYEIRYWFHSYEEYRQLESDILRSVWYRFRRNHIDVPYPVRDVRLRRQPPEARAEPPQQRLLQALGRVDVFRAVGEAGRAVAARAFRSECYAAGEVVIREGSPGESFFIVDHGEAAVFKGVSGAEVARLREGDYFGEMSLLTGEARAATIRAVTDVDVFTIDKAGFREILAASPGVEAEVSRTLAERQRALDAAARDYTAQGEPSRSTQELNQRILLRIRAYFGL
jgi:hypothetical protein